MAEHSVRTPASPARKTSTARTPAAKGSTPRRRAPRVVGQGDVPPSLQPAALEADRIERKRALLGTMNPR
jgi:hypothetical protein